jgi:hypothetical protein
VRVRVDEAGQQRAALQVRDDRLGALESGLHLAALADRDDPAALDRHRLCGGLLVVDRHDGAAGEDLVGKADARQERGGAGRGQRQDDRRPQRRQGPAAGRRRRARLPGVRAWEVGADCW